MIKGCLVKLKKDVVVDKYYNGYTTFPKGSLFTYEGLSVGLNKIFSPVDVIENEQPKSAFLSDDEFEVVADCKAETNTKELLLTKLNNINPYKYDIKISKDVDYLQKHCVRESICDGNQVKTVTHISIISGDFSATISSVDTCSFSVYETTDIFESKGYFIQYEGLFKEAYSILKPLLIIEL